MSNYYYREQKAKELFCRYLDRRAVVSSSCRSIARVLFPQATFNFTIIFSCFFLTTAFLDGFYNFNQSLNALKDFSRQIRATGIHDLTKEKFKMLLVLNERGKLFNEANFSFVSIESSYEKFLTLLSTKHGKCLHTIWKSATKLIHVRLEVSSENLQRMFCSSAETKA